ncbi:lytic transglycosylase [Amaricoccus sp.]|uniref:transglycosylase SLT domain-containing protein n=1 Tax=Amaricoccus sp. TaxID=1872485 RepID=UPI00261DF5E7|nr:lytic transglycosylase [uncultured Amaricoccus sp.]
MRRFALLAAFVLLSSCGGGEKPPSTVTDACRMQTERPHWFKAMSRTEARWGVPVSVQLATISRESSFEADARPTKKVGSGIFSRHVPRSSAYGYSQALDGTWEWYMRDTGQTGADRDDFADSSDFIGWYMNLNSRVNGVPLGDAYNQYLAYHEGKAGFAKGSYKKKAWLPGVARDVQAWSVRYAQQLQSCPIPG